MSPSSIRNTVTTTTQALIAPLNTDAAFRWKVLGFIIGVIVLAFHSVADTLIHLGWRYGDSAAGCGEKPWGLWISASILVAPFALGEHGLLGVLRLVAKIFKREG